MKLLAVLFIIVSISVHAQEKSIDKPKWKFNKNRILTGGLVLIGGSAKGFNETLMFNYRIFEKTFPSANKQWFDPKVSWRNKYEGGNPDNGAKYFGSTSIFVATTDQYHLNNFIGRAAIMSALVVKIGDTKQPFKHYLFDFLYYSGCYSLGFAATYYPFTSRNYK